MVGGGTGASAASAGRLAARSIATVESFMLNCVQNVARIDIGLSG